MNPNAPRAVELSLIIPAYNESAIILRNVDELERWMESHLPDVTYELIVVDDGSTDTMGQLLDERAKTDPVLRCLHHNGNRGRGRAIRTGFEGSHGRYAICLGRPVLCAGAHCTPAGTAASRKSRHHARLGLSSRGKRQQCAGLTRVAVPLGQSCSQRWPQRQITDRDLRGARLHARGARSA